MKRFILTIVSLIVVVSLACVAGAEVISDPDNIANTEAASDTTNNNWIEDFMTKVEGKAGYISIHDDQNSKEVLSDADEGVEWDLAVAMEIAKWRRFCLDAGVSEAGVVFGTVSTELFNVGDIWDFPGSNSVRVGVGAYLGKDVDAIDGLEWSDDWEKGLVVYLIDIDMDEE